MFFLIGVRSKAKAIGQVQRGCTKCTRATVHTAVEARKWLTLFFIPVIPLGGNNYVVRCNLCGLTLKASPELKSQLTTQAMAAKA
jgi:zinc-ribbon family